MKTLVFFALSLLAAVVIAGCAPQAIQPAAPTQTPIESKSGIANPASVYCEEQGGKLDIRTDSSGGQAGYCVFQDNSECDEWAFFRKECSQGNSAAGGGLSEPAPDVVVTELLRKQTASELKVEDTAVMVTKVEPVDWPDACLGAAKPDEMCAQVVTPGYRVILTVGQDNYTYHTNADGSAVRQETAGTKP